MMGMKKEMMVCTLGGGSGMPIVNKALVRSGVKKIKSIVTTFDSGGDSGRIGQMKGERFWLFPIIGDL